MLPLITAGDLQGIDQLAAMGALAGITNDEKIILTRAAAQAGQVAMLRHLFECHHLYATAPDELGRTVLHFAAMFGDAETVRFAVEVLSFDPHDRRYKRSNGAG
ncbi:MAG: ankyrin repeat domain-containing protein [Clostridia bacterium]|nr:ankyrin repeat domain-containing protein [Clostridia bacterium]